MKTLKIHRILFLLLFFASNLVNAQESKLDILLSTGISNYTLDFGDSKLNLSSRSSDIGILYNIGKNSYFKTGILGTIDLVSREDFSFHSYQIPLVYGFHINMTESKNTRMFFEMGAYLKGIRKFENFSENDYKTKTIFGHHTSFGMHFDLNPIVFSRIYLHNASDFSHSIVSENNKVKAENISIMVGFGLKLFRAK